MIVRFWVSGIPAPGGSKKQMHSYTTGKIITIEDCERVGTWRSRVEVAAYHAMIGRKPMEGPLRLTMTFFLPRPKSHYHVGKKVGQLRQAAPYFHTVKPDATKLVRSTEDACKDILWPDDSAVSQQAIDKVYEDGAGPGVMIQVEQIGESPAPIGRTGRGVL